jgi:hypothetical protein
MKDVVCGRRNLLHIPALFRRPAVERGGRDADFNTWTRLTAAGVDAGLAPA